MSTLKIENLLAINMGKSVLKEAIGDGYEFELIYEALLNNLEEDGSILGNLTDENEDNVESYKNYSSVGVGQSLEDMPLILRKESTNTGTLFLNNNSIDDTVTDINLLNIVSEEDSYSSDIDKIYEAVNKYSDTYEVDKNLILAIIKQESNFDKNATSSAGAKGLMQLMDFNSESYGVENPYDIEENIEAGVKHIKYCLDKFNGNVEMALMAYNAGEGTIERRGVKSIDDLYKMPEETQNYVAKIMNTLTQNI